MKKLLLTLSFLLTLVSSALAQNTTCSDRPPTDSSNACANTRFVFQHSSFITINAQTGNYTIQPSDCGKVVAFTGGPLTVVLPAVAGFSAGCAITVCNDNPNTALGRALRLSGFPSPFYPRMWMSLCGSVLQSGTAWQSTYAPDRLRVAFIPSIFVDVGGSDSNDGLISNGSLDAVADLQTCFTILQNELDIIGGPPSCLLTASEVYPGTTINYIRGNGFGVINVLGNGGIATLRTSTNVVLEMFDFSGYIIFSNIQFDCSFGTHPCIGLYLHQQNGVDLASAAPANGQIFFTGGATSDTGIWCDSQCKINTATALEFTGAWSVGIRLDLGSVASINNGMNSSSSYSSNMIQLSGGSQLLWSGGMGFGTNSAGQFLYASGGGTNAIFASTFTFSGAIGGGARSYAVLNGAILCNSSTTVLPGSAGIVSAAGAINGQAQASSGLCTP